MSKKILIASRYGIVRHGINLMLHAATPHTVIADGRALSEIGADLETLRPDLVVVDMLGRMESADVVKRTFETPDGTEPTKLLLLMDPAAADLHTAALLRRAQGVITPGCSPVQFLKAIDAILDGAAAAESPLPVGPADAASVPARRNDAAQAAAKIVTPREKQVIELVGRGLCNKRIARDLGISLTTVRTHRQKLMAKLGLHNAVEIAQFAARTQFV
ncbi:MULTISPECIES: response regulator transcription factor [Variovorax]|uniref:response regulator transcription factor n=1 Tax=Variovorax TaxID=34072 RepID=UPI002861535E|nr:response regulator transcription factor [Variovorax sp. 3319]MDR6890704.1 DNA-binding NarL/FixJ family response regulator [Variovorax sp. 3319]